MMAAHMQPQGKNARPVAGDEAPRRSLCSTHHRGRTRGPWGRRRGGGVEAATHELAMVNGTKRTETKEETCCRRRSLPCARCGPPRGPGTASRSQSGTGSTSCACSPGSSLWGACTWGSLWCWPGSSSGSLTRRCSLSSTSSPSHSPPACPGGHSVGGKALSLETARLPA